MHNVFGAFRRSGSTAPSKGLDANSPTLGQDRRTAAAASSDTGTVPAGRSAAAGWGGSRGSSSVASLGRRAEVQSMSSEASQQALVAAAGGEKETAVVEGTATAEAESGSQRENEVQIRSAAAPAQAAPDAKQQWTEEERVDYIQRLGLVGDGTEGYLLLEFLDDVLANTPLPAPWTTNRDKRQRLYFVNTATRETSWNHPSDLTLQELAGVCSHCCSLPSAAECDSYVRSVHAAWMQEAQDAMGKWFAADDGNGNSYYYHSETSETMWESPAEVVLPPFRAKLKAIAKLTDKEWTHKFEALHKASEHKEQKSQVEDPLPAPSLLAAPTSMADRTRAAEQAAAAAVLDKRRPEKAEQDPGQSSLPFVYQSGSTDKLSQHVQGHDGHPHTVSSMVTNSSPTGSSASSVSLSGRGIDLVAKTKELKKGSRNHQSDKARAAVPLLDLGAAAARENPSPQNVPEAKAGEAGKGATVTAQEVARRAQEEYAATEQALAQERERHKEALEQQEEWQAEKSALLAEVRQALQEQEAQSVEAQRREERELEARRMRSARRREDWLGEQESLRREMRQMLDMQREQAAEMERQEAQREQEHGKLEEELRDAIEKQQNQSAEDAVARGVREAQNRKLQDEANELREIQRAETASAQVQDKSMVNPRCSAALDLASNTMDRETSDWSFGRPRSSPKPALSNPHSAPLEATASSQDKQNLAPPFVSLGRVRDEAASSPPPHGKEVVQLHALQAQIAEIAKQLAEQKVAQQTTLENNAAQQDLAEELRTAIKSHTDVLQDVHKVLGEARARGSQEEAEETAARQEAVNHQLLEEIHQSLESQKGVLREAQSQSESNIQRQIEEALAARATAEPDSPALRIRSALQEKQKEVVEASETVTATLRAHVGEALAPLTQHIKDIECRQEELSELLIQQKQRQSEDNDLSKSSAAVDAMARQEAAQERLVQELHESLELQKAALREARNRAEPAIRSEVQLFLARNDASIMASQHSFESEVQHALEEKQREVVETNKATAAALQKQVAEALAPLTRHIKDVEQRQDNDALRVQADGERSRAQFEIELRKAREAQDRSLQIQLHMESAVQVQMSQAFEAFKVQIRDADRARADDLERMKQDRLTRKLAHEEHEMQKREERAARLQLQEAEIQQRERRREKDRLAEELHQAQESERHQREADLRQELEWKVEMRSMQFRDEQREMMLKSEYRELEWQVDWQAVQLLEDSDLLRPSSAQSRGRTRSQSRIRENLFNALAASREHLGFTGSDAEDPGDDVEYILPESGRLPRPSHAGKTKQLSASRRQGLSRGSSRPSSSNSRSSRRPASAVHSHRTLAAEIAADLASDPPRSRVDSSRRHRQHHSQDDAGGMPQKQHSSRRRSSCYDQDQQLLKPGGRSGTNKPVALTLDDICRAYPEVSQILSLG